MSVAHPRKYDAVIFDLLTALLNSWKLWNKVAGSDQDGLRWRRAYLAATYRCGSYRPYEHLIREAAETAAIPLEKADALILRWGELEPWSDVAEIVGALAQRVPLGVATNSSNALAKVAVAAVGVDFATVVTAEMAGYYKPRPEPYLCALKKLGVAPARTLFVAGSAADVPGATNAGMTVFWHNRAGLSFTADSARPAVVSDTLKPLLELV